MYYDEAAVLNRTEAVFAEDEVPFFTLKSEIRAYAYRCLVVDDDPVILRLVGEMLTDLDYHVSLAGDGLQALQAVSSHRYDLIVTDLDMPVLSGYHLAAKIKKNHPNTKIVIMTGHCQYELADLMSAGPVDAWLFKPFDMSQLCKVLDDLELPSSEWLPVSRAAMHYR
jgi:two-component system, NarL family, capsular synthesis sensor histidine kinase RcsC